MSRTGGPHHSKFDVSKWIIDLTDVVNGTRSNNDVWEPDRDDAILDGLPLLHKKGILFVEAVSG